MVPTVLAPDAVPEPGLEDVVARLDDGEAPAAAVRGLGGEHRQQGKEPIWTKTMLRVRPSSRPWSSR